MTRLMTVLELIKELSKLPPNKYVEVPGNMVTITEPVSKLLRPITQMVCLSCSYQDGSQFLMICPRCAWQPMMQPMEKADAASNETVAPIHPDQIKTGRR